MLAKVSKANRYKREGLKGGQLRGLEKREDGGSQRGSMGGRVKSVRKQEGGRES